MQGARQACRLQQQEIGSCHVSGYHESAAAGEQPIDNQWVEISWQCLDQVAADPMALPLSLQKPGPPEPSQLRDRAKTLES